jgi:hypothetical protein
MRTIKLDNTVLFDKLAALRISAVLHEHTNVTTEALVDALYSCTLNRSYKSLGYSVLSRITMPMQLTVGEEE